MTKKYLFLTRLHLRHQQFKKMEIFLVKKKQDHVCKKVCYAGCNKTEQTLMLLKKSFRSPLPQNQNIKL